LVTGSLIF